MILINVLKRRCKVHLVLIFQSIAKVIQETIYPDILVSAQLPAQQRAGNLSHARIISMT